jgi:hypothetical protein
LVSLFARKLVLNHGVCAAQKAIFFGKLAKHYQHGDCDFDVVSRNFICHRTLDNKVSFELRVPYAISTHASVEFRKYKIKRSKIPIIGFFVEQEQAPLRRGPGIRKELFISNAKGLSGRLRYGVLNFASL